MHCEQAMRPKKWVDNWTVGGVEWLKSRMGVDCGEGHLFLTKDGSGKGRRSPEGIGAPIPRKSGMFWCILVALTIHLNCKLLRASLSWRQIPVSPLTTTLKQFICSKKLVHICYDSVLWRLRLSITNMSVLNYSLADMYAGRIACCPLVSHSEHSDGTDRQTDRLMNWRQTVTLRFPSDEASVIKRKYEFSSAFVLLILSLGDVYCATIG